MVDVVETKVISMLDALQNGAIQLGDQVIKYTPDVVNAVLGVTIITGCQELLYGVIWMIVLIVCIKVYDKKNWVESPPVLLNLMSCGFGVIAVINSIITFGNIWNWVAVFYPKLYIAHQIINKVTDHIPASHTGG